MTGKLVPGSITVCSMGPSTAQDVKITGLCRPPPLRAEAGRRRLAACSGLPHSAARWKKMFDSYCTYRKGNTLWVLCWYGLCNKTKILKHAWSFIWFHRKIFIINKINLTPLAPYLQDNRLLSFYHYHYHCHYHYHYCYSISWHTTIID